MKKFILICLLGCASLAFAEKWSIALIGDTQYAMRDIPGNVYIQFNWITKHIDSLNLKYALHMGDVTDGSTSAEWSNADSAFKIFEKTSLPYSITPGNHDFNGGTLTNFNKTFPVSRIRAQLEKSSSYVQWGGSYPAGQNSNSYHLFTAGGVNWCLLELQFAACNDAAIMTWANSIVTQYPDRKFMVITHSYINGIVTDGLNTEGQILWDKLIKKYDNILFVYCGHQDGDRVYQKTTLLNTVVYAAVCDHQSFDARSTNQQKTRIIEFDTQAKTVRFSLYSPTAKLWYTDSKIKFTLNNVNFGTVVAVGPQGERLTYVLSFPSLSRIRLYTLSGKFVQECAVTGNIRQIGAVTKQFSRSGVYVAAMYGTSGLIGKQTIIVP